MRKRLYVVLPLLLFGGALPADVLGQTRLTENTLTRAEGATPPLAWIDAVAWLAGHWQGEGLGGFNEEVWAPPQAGAMMGMYRLVREGRTAFFEILTITEDAGGLVLRIKHFHPDLKGWEERDEVVTFPLVKLEPDAAYFDGLTFRRPAADRLDIYVVVGRGGDGQGEAHFRLRRAIGGVVGPAGDP
jgi:hypothetical protein